MFGIDIWDWTRNLAALAVGIWALVQFWHRVAPDLLAWWDRQELLQRMGARRYAPEEISAATRYYVKPDCQNNDPAGAEDFRHQVTAREPLFGAIDRIATNPGKYKFVIFLADSGMGKTSFFLKMGIRLTQVTPRCSMPADGRLPSEPDRVRGPF